MEFIDNSEKLVELLKSRRSYRSFSNQIPDEKIIRDCIKIAALAPSGANMQPWTYILIKNKELRHALRNKCEEIEKEFYEKKAPEQWKNDLKPLKTNFSKPFLTDAPYLIAAFAQSYGIDKDGNEIKHYFVNESINISIGFLIYSLHLNGLTSLTYTPSPNSFLIEMLGRGKNERPVFLIPVGYPDENYQLPNIYKKVESEYLQVL